MIWWYYGSAGQAGLWVVLVHMLSEEDLYLATELKFSATEKVKWETKINNQARLEKNQRTEKQKPVDQEIKTVVHKPDQDLIFLLL